MVWYSPVGNTHGVQIEINERIPGMEPVPFRVIIFEARERENDLDDYEIIVDTTSFADAIKNFEDKKPYHEVYEKFKKFMEASEEPFIPEDIK